MILQWIIYVQLINIWMANVFFFFINMNIISNLVTLQFDDYGQNTTYVLVTASNCGQNTTHKSFCNCCKLSNLTIQGIEYILDYNLVLNT